MEFFDFFFFLEANSTISNTDYSLFLFESVKNYYSKEAFFTYIVSDEIVYRNSYGITNYHLYPLGDKDTIAFSELFPDGIKKHHIPLHLYPADFKTNVPFLQYNPKGVKAGRYNMSSFPYSYYDAKFRYSTWFWPLNHIIHNSFWNPKIHFFKLDFEYCYVCTPVEVPGWLSSPARYNAVTSFGATAHNWEAAHSWETADWQISGLFSMLEDSKCIADWPSRNLKPFSWHEDFLGEGLHAISNDYYSLFTFRNDTLGRKFYMPRMVTDMFVYKPEPNYFFWMLKYHLSNFLYLVFIVLPPLVLFRLPVYIIKTIISYFFHLFFLILNFFFFSYSVGGVLGVLLFLFFFCLVCFFFYWVFSFFFQFFSYLFFEFFVALYDILKGTVLFFYRQLVWWHLKINWESDFLRVRWFNIAYNAPLKESLDYQRMTLLRIIRFFFFHGCFYYREIKNKIFMNSLKGFFSVFLFPILFFFHLFIYKVKFYLMNNALYKIVWRLLVFIKNTFFYTKQLDVFFSMMSSIFRKYKYVPVTTYIIPAVLWEKFGSNFLYIASFFRPVFKDFFIKFDKVSVDFKIFGFFLWVFCIFFYYVLLIFSFIFTFFVYSLSRTFYLVYMFFKLKISKSFFLTRFSFFKFLYFFLSKISVLFYVCVKKFIYMFVYIYSFFRLFFIGFIFFFWVLLKNFFHLLYLIICFFFKSRVFWFFFFIFLFVGPLNFVVFFFSWLAIVVDYWVSLFITPLFNLDFTFLLYKGKVDGMMLVSVYKSQVNYFLDAWEEFYFLWWNEFTFWQKIYSLNHLAFYKWYSIKYYWIGLFWATVEFYIFFQTAWFGFFLYVVIDFITSVIAYISYLYDFITDFFIVKFITTHFVSLYNSFYDSFFLSKLYSKLSKYSIIFQLLEFWKYSNWGYCIRWIYFYSFFDFFNFQVFFLFFTSIIASLCYLPFYLSIIYSFDFLHDFYFFFWNFFFQFFRKFTSVFNMSVGSTFYWYLYSWLKLKVFFDDFCLIYGIKSYRLCHFDLKYLEYSFVAHSHEFDFRSTMQFNYSISFFNSLTKSDKSFVYLITQYMHLQTLGNLKLSRPPIVYIKHILFSYWKYYYFLCFLMCFLFSEVSMVFCASFETSGNPKFFWRRFRDLREEDIEYMFNLSSKIQKRMQDIQKAMQKGGQVIEPWKFWLYPTFLYSWKSGDLDFNNTMRKMIREESSVVNRILFRSGMRRWEEFLKRSKNRSDLHRREVFLWEWFLHRYDDAHYLYRGELFFRRENYTHMSAGLLALSTKLFGSDMLKYYKTINYDFSSYYLDPKFKEYYKALLMEYPKIAMFMAYSYKQQKYLKKLMQNEDYIDRIPADMHVVAREKNELFNTLFEYFYALDKNLYNFKLPSWAFHKDMDNLMLIYNHSTKTAYKTEERDIKTGETFWESEAEINLLESGFIWLFWAPIFALLILTSKLGILWNDFWWLYEIRQTTINMYLTFSDWTLEYFKHNYFSYYYAFSIEIPNSPGFKDEFTHANFGTFQRKSAMYAAWIKNHSLWFYHNESHITRIYKYFIYRHHPTVDFYNCLSGYKYFFFIIFAMSILVIYKNIKEIYTKVIVYKSNKFRKLTFLHLSRLEAYRRLKVNLRKGFLWFWR